MNDAIREKLSAYLDGALLDEERRAVEVELSSSEELRQELEAMRAVSKAVKRLPRESLPAGFRARLDARRTREAKPEREYFLLPPAYRPIAFALSSAVVALVVWDRARAPEEDLAVKVGWDGDRIAVKSAAEAPSSIDLSARLSSISGGQAPMAEVQAPSAEDGSTFGKHLNAPGKPVEVPEDEGSNKTVEDKDGSFSARNEEERSDINERLYKGFEEEKKRMGIVQILEKSEENDEQLSGGREMMALQAAPEAARVARAHLKSGGLPAVRGAGQVKPPEAPTATALALRSADALYTAWAAAGLPGKPPAVDFPSQMAIFLAGPQGCGIASVQNRKKFIVVLYKDSGFDDASSRVRAVHLSAKPVVVKRAE